MGVGERGSVIPRDPLEGPSRLTRGPVGVINEGSRSLFICFMTLWFYLFYGI